MFVVNPLPRVKMNPCFATGDCQQLLHRYCAGVSLSCYKEMKREGDSFYCYGCSERRNKRDLAVLKHTVELLKQEIAELKKTLSQVQSESNVPPQDCGTHSQPSYASITGSGESVTDTRPKPQVVTTKERYHLDKKFNIIIYGIKECQKGTSKRERLESDLNSVVSVLTGVDNTIQSQSIKDIYRLGKFSQYHKYPRPLLVKFIRAADASTILSKKSSCESPCVH